MKKIQLHWQILIALLLAIVYGLVFSTNYELADEDFVKFSQTGMDMQSLISIKNVEFSTKREFTAQLSTLSDSNLLAHQSTIIKAAYENTAVNAVSWLGDLFLRALKMLIIPLILSSLISGITSIGSGGSLGRLGLKTIAYYITTSLFAILTGLILVNLFKPGVGADLNFTQKVEGLVEKQRSFDELLIEIVPNNIFQSLMEGDMLSIIFFAILFGFFITRVSKKSSELLSSFFQSVFDVMMKITLFVIKFTPLGIFGIVAKVVADQDDLSNLLVRMGLYMGTVILALLIHFFVILPLITKYIGKCAPFRHLKNMSTPIMTAFSTSSSGATLPLTITAVENKSGVSNRISSFTLPLGATINMDGTALYECVAAIFIAQAYGVDLSVAAQIIIVGTALLASIGAAAIPMAGLVMITVILSAVQLPLEGVGLILAVDRILDMFRTATNVWSDSCGAVIIAKSEGENLNV
jgi:proton glutamate symport protein